MLTKRSERECRRGSLAATLGGQARGLDRRGFLRRAGLIAGGLGALGALPLTGVRKAEAGPPAKAGVPVELHIYAGIGHGFGLRPTPAAGWPDRMREFLVNQKILTAANP